MHVAICDDNVADRKQMERLLSRESEKRMSTTGNLFVDSYGNAPSLLENPLQYNAYYIDMCKTEGVTGETVVNALLQKQIHALFIMCCSDVNYRELNFPENVIFLDKPIKAAELSDTIDQALEYRKKSPSLIELREITTTHYITEPEILYGIEQDKYVLFTLTEGRKMQVATSALNFLSQVENFPAFVAASEKVVLNCRHITKFSFFKVTMSDGATFKMHHSYMPYAKEMQQELNARP